MKYVALILLSFLSVGFYATNDPSDSFDPLEITFIKKDQLWNINLQNALRSETPWQNFHSDHDTWQVYFNEENQKPHRAYGKAIPVFGGTAEEKAHNFILDHLIPFGVSLEQLELIGIQKTDKYSYVNYIQKHEGIEVINSRLVLKIHENGVVMFGTEVYENIEFDINPGLSDEELTAIAENNMVQEIIETIIAPDEYIIPIYSSEQYIFHRVRKFVVHTMSITGIPANYETYIDKHSGEILYRVNQVKHHGSCDKCHDPEKKKVHTMGMPPVNGNITAELYPVNTIEGLETLPLPNLSIVIDGEQNYTDNNGDFASGISAPVNAEISLEGLFASIKTGGVTPDFLTGLNDIPNQITFDGQANYKELSAYLSVNRIHDHMKLHLPSFTNLDFPISVNIDVAGECNAFYDGQLNFFDFGGGCTATSLISDVVAHEYGHGINSQYYISQGSSFNNGAMNEGYADFWAISLSLEPNFSQDFFTGSTDGLRRYDIDPKIYPEDLIGQVHADGEIICGAWFDTHLQMGDDWELTMDIFSEAFAGLQATGFNGNEGEIFVDVLLDALQADDDDGDITNGTPNDLAIIEGFDIHGISLLGSIQMFHENLLASEADETIIIEAEIDVDFPASIYFGGAQLLYKINDQLDFNQTELLFISGDTYEAEIPSQEPGTLITYYLALEDNEGNLTGYQPTGVVAADPTLPYYTLIGMETVAIEDNDFSSELGFWETGVSEDNATAGEWEWAIPVGSFGTPGDISTIIAPNQDHTEGDGEYAFVTGQSASSSSSIYDNDVDDGWTTLRSDIIDLSEYEDPIITYWRWFVNTSNVNEGWIVEISDDGGENWIAMESTITEDVQWRRNAIRLSDHLEINDQFRIQFIASDPIFEGSGALVEAAVDDIYIWDVYTEPEVSVEEQDVISLTLYPNPANNQINLALPRPGYWNFQVFDDAGRLLINQIESIDHSYRLNISALPQGAYLIKAMSDEQILTSGFFKE